MDDVLRFIGAVVVAFVCLAGGIRVLLWTTKPLPPECGRREDGDG